MHKRIHTQTNFSPSKTKGKKSTGIEHDASEVVLTSHDYNRTTQEWSWLQNISINSFNLSSRDPTLLTLEKSLPHCSTFFNG